MGLARASSYSQEGSLDLNYLSTQVVCVWGITNHLINQRNCVVVVVVVVVVVGGGGGGGGVGVGVGVGVAAAVAVAVAAAAVVYYFL